MKLQFKPLAMLTAFIFIALAAAWLLNPKFFLDNWGVDFSYATGLVGRRGAALCAGIGVMFFLARNEPASPTRSAMVNGFVVTCLMLATLGAYELQTGHVGLGILAAVFIELVLSIGLLCVECAKKTSHLNGIR